MGSTTVANIIDPVRPKQKEPEGGWNKYDMLSKENLEGTNKVFTDKELDMGLDLAPIASPVDQDRPTYWDGTQQEWREKTADDA